MSLKITDVMRRNPMTVGEDDDLALAQEIMVWTGARHLPVMREGRLTGVVSERDILRVRAEHPGPEPLKTRIGDAMSHPGHYTSPDEPIAIAAERMAANKIGCLAVLEQGKLVGIVTATDLLRAQLRDEGVVAPREPALRERTARDLMTSNPVTTSPGEYVAQAIAKMALAGIRHLPVVDPADRLIGMVTDRDIPLLGDATQWNGKLAQMKVSGVMSLDAPTVSPDANMDTLLELFADWRVGALAVVGAKQTLLGIVSYVDVLEEVAKAVTSERDAA